MERVDLLIDLRFLNQPWTYLIRVATLPNGNLYILRARAPARVFAKIEEELRQMLESFEPASQ